jgi:alpha-ketoglutarate-dependent taurine dioxygenase
LADDLDPVRISPPGQLRDFLTHPDPGLASIVAARAGLAELASSALDSAAGVLVLTGLPADAEHGERAVRRVTELLGEPLPQNRQGAVVREVRDRGTAIGEGQRARYSDSRFGGSLHTDGAEAPLPPPDVFTLFCVRQSESGGALRLVHVRDLLTELSSRPDLVEVLREPFHFDRRGDQGPGEAPTVAKPVLFTRRNQLAITYLRSYIERGHEHPGMPALRPVQRAALDYLDSVVDSGRLARTGKLREGELALFDNLSLLHGRTEFQDAPRHPRLLLRTWVRRLPRGAR